RPRPPLFPYTTLFRSCLESCGVFCAACVCAFGGEDAPAVRGSVGADCVPWRPVEGGAGVAGGAGGGVVGPGRGGGRGARGGRVASAHSQLTGVRAGKLEATTA